MKNNLQDEKIIEGLQMNFVGECTEVGMYLAMSRQADTSIHGHFKCEKCKKVYDFKINFSDLDLSGLDQFQIDEHHFYFKGRCFNCRKDLH